MTDGCGWFICAGTERPYGEQCGHQSDCHEEVAHITSLSDARTQTLTCVCGADYARRPGPPLDPPGASGFLTLIQLGGPRAGG